MYDSDVAVSWAKMSADPYNRDPSAKCLPCQTPAYAPPTYGTPAPPPALGQAPCVACPPDATFNQRRNTRDAGPPCCVTETYGYGTTTWPWQSSDLSSVSSAKMGPRLWEDLYAVKDRARTGFAFSPVFNPYVL